MKKLTPIIIVVMTAALMLSACGGGAAPAPSGGAKPAPTEAPKQPVSKPTEKPADKPAQPPVDTPASGTDQNNTDAINLTDVTSGLESLNSYETQFTMTFEGKDDSRPTQDLNHVLHGRVRQESGGQAHHHQRLRRDAGRRNWRNRHG